MSERYDVIVIGSGIGGLAAGGLLARLEGSRVLVLEIGVGGLGSRFVGGVGTPSNRGDLGLGGAETLGIAAGPPGEPIVGSVGSCCPCSAFIGGIASRNLASSLAMIAAAAAS